MINNTLLIRVFLIALAVVIVVGLLLILPVIIIPIALQFSPRIPNPDITYGEFPFSIEYEFNEQIHVIEDTLIAEFDGFRADAGSMSRHRIWRSSLASSKENDVTSIPFNFEGEVDIKFYPGPAGYYMGEFEGLDVQYRPHIQIVLKDPMTQFSKS